MGQAWERAQRLWAELADLERAAAVLEWDQLVCMPPGGARARGEQLATLRRLAHQRLTGPEMGEALAAAAADPDADPAWVRVARRRYAREVAVPAELVEARARAGTEGYMAWAQARQERSFPVFAPALARVLELTRSYADAVGWEGERYDALLQGHEPGMTTAELRRLFAELEAALPPLLRAIASRPAPGLSPLAVPVPAEQQLAVGRHVVAAFGYVFARGRQDLSLHPFSTSFGPGDCRITTRIDPHDFGVAFFATLHEAGHALYEQGIPEAWARGPLGEACSTGVHESQSRLWENLVGRSLPFWEWLQPQLARLLPPFADSTPEGLFRGANTVRPSLIRVEADEVTYNLHIAVRLHLELELLSGNLPVQELPAAWDAAMQRTLGLVPPDPVQGVLQDIHWSDGGFGYFPSYTLGNLLAAQWMELAHRRLGELDAQIRRGEFGPLLQLLRQAIHRRGASLTPAELVQELTGGPIRTQPFLDYLGRKFGALYGLGPAR